MRIIHTSDWHLGQYFYGKSRAKEHQQFLTWLLAQVEKHNVDAVIVAGDIFDTGTPPSYAREMYFDFVVNMHKLQCTLVVLAGNHDSVAMLSESKSLLSHLSTQVIPCAHSIDFTDFTDISEDLKRSQSFIDEQVFYLRDKQGKPKVVLCAIPYIRPRDVIKSQAGQSSTDKQQSLQQAISAHYQQLYIHAKTLAETPKSATLPIIATGHLTTVGVSVSESVRDIYIGTLEAFPANAFPSVDYIALGHIHRAQKVAKTEHIRYCGSPIPLSFDEAKDHVEQGGDSQKSVFLVEFLQNEDVNIDAERQVKNSTENTSLNVTPLFIPCFQPMAVIKTSFDNIAATVQDLIDKSLEKSAGNFFNPSEGSPVEKMWLDIEIESADYLQDIQARIDQLLAAFPVEVLLVRRSKKARQLMPHNQKKITLDELTLEDVFNERLNKETWQTTDELERKTRLTTLFKKAVEEVKSESPLTSSLKRELNTAIKENLVGKAK